MGYGGEVSADGPAGNARYFGTAPISRMARGAPRGFRQTGTHVVRMVRNAQKCWVGWRTLCCVSNGLTEDPG